MVEKTNMQKRPNKFEWDFLMFIFFSTLFAYISLLVIFVRILFTIYIIIIVCIDKIADISNSVYTFLNNRENLKVVHGCRNARNPYINDNFSDVIHLYRIQCWHSYESTDLTAKTSQLISIFA